MHIVRWVAAASMMLVGASLLSTAYAGRRLEKYRDPLPAKLAELEQGTPPPSIHVTVDMHWELRSHYGYTHELNQENTPDQVCFLITSDGSPFLRALRATNAGHPGEAMRASPLTRPVLLVTDRYGALSEIPENDDLVGPITGMLEPNASHQACEQLLPDLGISANDCLLLKEGKTPLTLPFAPFALTGLLLLLGAPVPPLLARRRDRAQAVGSAAAALPPVPPFSNPPPASGLPASELPPGLVARPSFRPPVSQTDYPPLVPSSRPPVGSLPPPGLDLRPGASVLVRRGAQRLSATVVVVEPGRCRCEFEDGKQAWVGFNDVRNA